MEKGKGGGLVPILGLNNVRVTSFSHVLTCVLTSWLQSPHTGEKPHGDYLSLWCQPSKRHTRQVSYAPLFLEVFALLSRAVVFSICSLHSAILPWPFWW